MKKFLMISLMAVLALSMTSQSSAMNPAPVVVEGVNQELTKEATLWVDYVDTPEKKRPDLNFYLRSGGCAMQDPENCRQTLDFVTKFLHSAELQEKDRVAKITALAQLMQKVTKKSFLQRHHGGILTVLVVSGILVADYAGYIGKTGEFDAHIVMLQSLQEWYAWLRGTSVPSAPAANVNPTLTPAPMPATPVPAVNVSNPVLPVVNTKPRDFAEMVSLYGTTQAPAPMPATPVPVVNADSSAWSVRNFWFLQPLKRFLRGESKNS